MHYILVNLVGSMQYYINQYVVHSGYYCRQSALHTG